jgi:hypothetical protein
VELAIYRKAFGEGHPWVVRQLKSLAVVARNAGRLDDSEAYLREGMAAVALLDPPNPTMRARLEVDLGLLALGRERPDEALRLCASAVAFFDEHRTREDDVVTPLYCVGSSLQELGRDADSIAPLDRGLAIMKRISYPPGQMSGTQFHLARGLWRSAKDRARARALVDEALPHMSAASRAEAEAELRRWRAGQAQRRGG